MIRCPNCGKKTSEFAVNCPHCGKKNKIDVNNTLKESSSIKANAKKIKVPIIICIVLVIFILVTIVPKIFVSVKRDTESESIAISPSEDCIELAQKTIDVINQYENGARPDGNTSQDAIDYYNKAFSSCSSILDKLDKKNLAEMQDDNILDYTIYADYLAVSQELVQLHNAKYYHTSLDTTATYADILKRKKELQDIIG